AAAGSEIVIVMPPPGVPSGLGVPDMASTSPRDEARPRPRPLALSRLPSRWNGWNIGVDGARPSSLGARRGGSMVGRRPAIEHLIELWGGDTGGQCVADVEIV